MRLLATIIAAVLPLGGCGTDDKQTAESMPAPTSPAGPPTVQRYQSVEALKDAAVAAGLPCPAWVQDNAVEAAAESGTCSDDSVLSTYATDADLQFALEN